MDNMMIHILNENEGKENRDFRTEGGSVSKNYSRQNSMYVDH